MNNNINKNMNYNINNKKNYKKENVYDNIEPNEEIKIMPIGRTKDITSHNINKAIEENKGKTEYIEHTYGTVQKNKNVNKKKKQKSKVYFIII